MSTAPRSPAEPGVGVLMFVAVRHIEQRVLAALQDAGYSGTLAQGRLFARIGPDGNRVTELAEMAQVTKQTAAFLVERLEEHGYVERVPDPTDARARVVRIAERGQQAQRIAVQVEEAIYAEWAAHLGQAELDRLRATMLRLRAVTDPYATDESGPRPIRA